MGIESIEMDEQNKIADRIGRLLEVKAGFRYGEGRKVIFVCNADWESG